MDQYNTQTQYVDWKKPDRSPEPWVFGAVWSVLYVIIAVVMTSVVVKYIKKQIPFSVLLPFILNLIANLLFTYIQFKLLNRTGAFIDIVVVLVTIVWGMIAIWKYNKRLSLAYVPYLAWVSIATVLQYQVMMLNK